MDIRLLERADLPALLHLYRDLHRADEPVPPRDIVESVWTEMIATKRNICFGGFVGTALVSSCTIAIIPNLTRGCRPYAIIENVVTSSAHRRSGYGTAVLRAALVHAWEAGCYKAMLMTGRKDEGTLRFYRSAGFDANDKLAFVAKSAA